MNADNQLKLQAYLDGELPEGEARQIAELMAQDGEARALFGELQNTKNALAGNEAEFKLPEAREFYWSKIRRQIERETAPAAERAPQSFFSHWWRYATPLAGLAAMIAVLTISGRQIPGIISGEVETSDEMTAFTFRSQSDPMTMVWLADKDTSEPEPVAASNNVDTK